MVSRLEKKVFFVYDKNDRFLYFIALRIHYDETGTDHFTRLLKSTGYRGKFVWIIQTQGGGGGKFYFDDLEWESELFSKFHRLLKTGYWDNFKDGQIIHPKDILDLFNQVYRRK